MIKTHVVRVFFIANEQRISHITSRILGLVYDELFLAQYAKKTNHIINLV
jgi:hypothetical protein